MKLAAYLEIEGNSASKLAEATGVAVSTITRAAKGEITPSRKLMALIYEKTDGHVTPNDFWGIAA
ncbi:helix-turn-helix domain-containing protein [Pelagerythrobacter aerophilus]|uniref:XRE family transcriptional regulator n=1 Tax=Pelagerythrobacter aerophilus TaxID=2306995 RepID=A0A418NJP0_9SPHN|nr:helix-turn-helix transcriptional regulator [Pelagerythrobacter aerophilus]RIV79548.1 XRE family transcriptional regulator [Pelagerythrobacter aerophilus]